MKTTQADTISEGGEVRLDSESILFMAFTLFTRVNTEAKADKRALNGGPLLHVGKPVREKHTLAAFSL